MLTGWWQRIFGTATGPSTSLDDLLTAIIENESLEVRKPLWNEVIRRFVLDVKRPCTIAGAADPKTKAAEIMEKALQGVGEPVERFSRELVRVMKAHLGEAAVRPVLPLLYLRQFLHELPPRLLPYAEGLLDTGGSREALATNRNENPADVYRLCNEALAALPESIAREYKDAEIFERTDGIWDLTRLGEFSRS